MCDNKLDPRFYPEVYQAVAGKDYTVYAYMNDGARSVWSHNGKDS